MEMVGQLCVEINTVAIDEAARPVLQDVHVVDVSGTENAAQVRVQPRFGDDRIKQLQQITPMRFGADGTRR